MRYLVELIKINFSQQQQRKDHKLKHRDENKDAFRNGFRGYLLAPHVPPTRLSEIRPRRRKSDEGRSSIIFPLVRSRASVSAARANAVPVSASPETASNRFNLSISF